MKKIWMIVAVACAALMISCSSAVEKKAQDIVKRSAEASARGDWAALERIAAEEEAYFNTLSPEEQKEYNEACIEAAKDLLK